MTISNHLINVTHRLQSWMQNDALPFWTTVGINDSNGSVYERLLNNGQPDTCADNRTRVQARQAFVFSSAAHHGWLPNALPVVANIVNFMEKSAKPSQNESGYAHLLSADGNIIDAKFDAYDFAFYILACAHRYQAFGDLHALHQINQLTELMDYKFKQAPGGWMEGNYDCEIRRQNPHMHLFEAFMACYKVTNHGKWLARAGEIFTLFETVFYDSEHQVVLEFFDHNWQPIAEQAAEPGHMFEWVWLLREYQALTGTPVDHYCNALYQKAFDQGRDKNSGLVFDQTNNHGISSTGTKRCWPLTELIKASLAQANAGDHFGEANAAQAIELLFEFYLSSNVTGCYFDQVDRNNQVITSFAPASTLYHIMVATTEAVRYCQNKV